MYRRLRYYGVAALRLAARRAAFLRRGPCVFPETAERPLLASLPLVPNAELFP